MEILKCENVRKVYGSGNNQVVALDHIDLSVQKGEFLHKEDCLSSHNGLRRSVWNVPYNSL